MLFAHMDQLGFVVRKIEASGFLRLERLGGVPERALAAQELLICVGEGRDVRAIIGNKSHHATSPEDKYRVVPYQEILVDAGFPSAEAALSAGVKIGSPVVYAPKAFALAEDKIAGTSVDDRAGCAVVVEVARLLTPRLTQVAPEVSVGAAYGGRLFGETCDRRCLQISDPAVEPCRIHN